MKNEKINELVKSFVELEKAQGWTNVSTKKNFTLQEKKVKESYWDYLLPLQDTIKTGIIF